MSCVTLVFDFLINKNIHVAPHLHTCPLWCFLFPRLKVVLKGKWLQDIQKIQQTSITELYRIKKQLLKDFFGKWRRRLAQWGQHSDSTDQLVNYAYDFFNAIWGINEQPIYIYFFIFFFFYIRTNQQVQFIGVGTGGCGTWRVTSKCSAWKCRVTTKRIPPPRKPSLKKVRISDVTQSNSAETSSHEWAHSQTCPNLRTRFTVWLFLYYIYC